MNQVRWSDMRLRAEKCLNTWKPRPLREIANLAFAKKWWQADKTRVKAKSSRCLSANLWDWFNTSGAACVKSHEGAWTSNTGNGYYGGFQADMDFQSSYGPEYLRQYGTANNWPPIAQIHMAYRGWLARGWAPWPTTARRCGLL